MTSVQLLLIIGNIWLARGCHSRTFASLIGVTYAIVSALNILSVK